MPYQVTVLAGITEQSVAVSLQLANRATFRTGPLKLVTVAHGLELYNIGPCIRFSLAVINDRTHNLRVPTFRVDHKHLATREIQLCRKAFIGPDVDMLSDDGHGDAILTVQPMKITG